MLSHETTFRKGQFNVDMQFVACLFVFALVDWKYTGKVAPGTGKNKKKTRGIIINILGWMDECIHCVKP